MINAQLNIHLNPSLILSLRVFDSVQISSYSYYSYWQPPPEKIINEHLKIYLNPSLILIVINMENPTFRTTC